MKTALFTGMARKSWAATRAFPLPCKRKASGIVNFQGAFTSSEGGKITNLEETPVWKKTSWRRKIGCLKKKTHGIAKKLSLWKKITGWDINGTRIFDTERKKRAYPWGKAVSLRSRNQLTTPSKEENKGRKGSERVLGGGRTTVAPIARETKNWTRESRRIHETSWEKNEGGTKGVDEKDRGLKELMVTWPYPRNY